MTLLDAMKERDGKTIVIVTHDQELVRGRADRTIRLRDGRLSDEIGVPDNDARHTERPYELHRHCRARLAESASG